MREENFHNAFSGHSSAGNRRKASGAPSETYGSTARLSRLRASQHWIFFLAERLAGTR
jgi:hypothetical protein